MTSLFSTMELLYPRTKRQTIRVVSSKVQPLHTPRRVRFRVASKLGEKSRKEIKKVTITKNSSTTLKIKRVNFEINPIPNERNHSKPSYQSGASLEESAKRRPSQARRSITAGSGKKEKPVGIYGKFNGLDIRKPACSSATRPQSSRDCRAYDSAKNVGSDRHHRHTSTDTRQREVFSTTVKQKADAITPAELRRRSGFRVDCGKKLASPVKNPGQKVSATQTARRGKPVSIQGGMSSGRAKTVHRRNNRLYFPVNNDQSRPLQSVTTERPVGSSRPLSGTKPVMSSDSASLKHVQGHLERFFDTKVSLRQKEIMKNSETVNDFLDGLLPLIVKQDKIFGLRMLKTGSYYEKLKVSKPTEFDMMLVFDFIRFSKFFNVEYNYRIPATMLYAKLKFQDHVKNGREMWGAFLTADGKYLSPGKLLDRFFSLVQEAVKNPKWNRRHRVSDVEQNGPAVKLTIDREIDLDLVLSIEILEWPRCARGWGDSKRIWPSRREVEEITILKPKCYLVAKPCEVESRGSCDFWRISFSEAEKMLLRPEYPDKKCYRIVKAIYQAKKQELAPLNSFHLKNLLLQRRCDHPREKPDDSKMALCVVKFLQDLIQRLTKGTLPHFFVSRVNLLAKISQEDRLNIARKLKNYVDSLVRSPGSFLRSLKP